MNLSPEKIVELQKKFPAEYRPAKESEMLPVADAPVDWEDYSTMKEMTCKNHPFARYLTKNPWSRGLHFIQGPHGLMSMIDPECDCPFEDLRVVIRETERHIWGECPTEDCSVHPKGA